MSIADKILNNNNATENKILRKKNKKIKYLPKIKEQSKQLMEKAKAIITFSKPILKRGDNGVIYPNTINTVQGASGVHKSRLVEIMISCFLSKSKSIAGFESGQEFYAHISYIDTERNRNNQFPFSIQQIKKLTDTPREEDLDNFNPITLVDIPRDERFSSLEEYFDDLRTVTDRHVVVVLDVITDCIENFNDPKKSMELIDLMNKLINEFNLTFICVIHQNPGSDKARGHLGTELINKSSTVLQIGFDDADKDLIKVTYRKCRNSKRFEPFYLVYSKEERTLVEADADQIRASANNKVTKAKIEEVKQFIYDNIKQEIPKADLLKKLKGHFDCGSRTIGDRLKQILDDDQGIIKDTNSFDIIKIEQFMDGKSAHIRINKEESEAKE